jgi:hypothetical protein
VRRATHSAGYSWRKWEDPIVYRRLPQWTVWGWSIVIGASAALLLVAVR